MSVSLSCRVEPRPGRIPAFWQAPPGLARPLEHYVETRRPADGRQQREAAAQARACEQKRRNRQRQTAAEGEACGAARRGTGDGEARAALAGGEDVRGGGA